MILTENDLIWWSNHTPKEIQDKYEISPATYARWKKKNNAITLRKQGSGKPFNFARYKSCKMCCSFHLNALYCSRRCQSNDEDYIQMLKNIDRSYTQSDEYRNKLRKDNTPEYKRYSGRVHRITQKIYEEHIDLINPNRLPRTVCGVEGGYQLDHIIPIKFGFENNIPPEVLSRPDNLRMLPWKENLMRNWNE